MTDRIFGLDVLRAMAICLVLVSHTFEFFVPNLSAESARFFGFWGVEIFFVLSGFLIGRILLKQFYGETGLGRKELKRFWIRRWFRTLPLYYLCLAIYLVTYFILGLEVGVSLGDLLPYVVFLQNSISPHPGFYAIAWSLSIEEWFYLCFPVGLMVSSLLAGRKQSAVWVLILSVVMVSLGLRLYLSTTYDLAWGPWYRKMIFWRLDSITMGVAAAALSLRGGSVFSDDGLLSVNRSRRSRRRVLTIVSIGAVAVLSGYFWKTYVTTGESNLFLDTIFFNLCSIALAGLLPVFYIWRQCTWPILGGIVTWLSKISYSLYLIHWLVLIVSVHVLELPYGWQYFLLIISVSMIIATMLYQFFEKPTTRLRERYS